MATMTEAERESLRQLVAELREASFMLGSRSDDEALERVGGPARRMTIDRLERKVLGLVERNEDEFQRLLRWIDEREVPDDRAAATG